MQKVIDISLYEIEKVKMEITIEKTKLMIVNEKQRRDINQIKYKGRKNHKR